MTEIAVYVTPKEIRQKLSHYTAKERIEGSHWRGGLGRRSYTQMRNDNWYVFVTRSTGKIKTIQGPQWKPYGYGDGDGRHGHGH